MRTTPLRLAFRLVLILAPLPSLCATGCLAVKPYEREVLSLRSMNGEREQAENKFTQHYTESREGIAGGYCAAGGGCGCN